MSEELTRYDNPHTSPTPDVLQIHFSLLAAVNVLVTVSSLILILGILRSKQVRSNAFNLYLLFMAIPDFIAAFLCLITCVMGAYQSEYYSEWMCQFQSFYLTSTFAANAWVNAVIIHEVYKLIRFSHGRRRYFPPSRQQVFCRVAMVYTYGIAWGLMASVVPGLPVKPSPFYGLVCMPMEYDLPSTLFFYLAYVPGIMVLPLMYSLGVIIHILSKGLLPKSGRNRVISTYLLQLIALYFLFWLPCLILKVIGNFIKIDPWLPWAGSVLSHTQGLFSSLFAVLTSDTIRHEVRMVLQCKLTAPSIHHDSHGDFKSGSKVKLSNTHSPEERGHHASMEQSGRTNEDTSYASSHFLHEELHVEVLEPCGEENTTDLEAGAEQQVLSEPSV